MSRGKGDTLSENDYSDKVVSSSDQDGVDSGRANEEYEVISAPIKRNTQNDIRANRVEACSSAYKLSMQTGKMSIDSLTELSSPYDEGSSSNKTLPPSANKNDEDETKRKTANNHLKTGGKSHLISNKAGGALPDGSNMQVKNSNAQQQTSKKTYQGTVHKVSMLNNPQQQTQSHGTSNFLQNVVANSTKQQLTVSQKNSGGCGVV